MNKTKILFVCLGNICRSPLANEVLQDLVNRANLQDAFEIDSCGIGAWHIGHLPDIRMRKEAKKHGLNLTHRARQIAKEDFAHYDLILAMDKANLSDLMRLCPAQYRAKIKLFRTFDLAADDNAEVPDPYYGGDEGFSNVYQMVERSCIELLRQHS